MILLWFHFGAEFWPRDVSSLCRPLFLLNLFFTLSNWVVLRCCSVATNLKCDRVSILLVHLHIPSVSITRELLLVRHWQNHASSFIYWRFWTWHEISNKVFLMTVFFTNLMHKFFILIHNKCIKILYFNT
jgi:hypothetical protein